MEDNKYSALENLNRLLVFHVDYGDVVTFDTTYRTNQYSMPLALFVGFNNQLQNIVFAQALIRDERADTFEWVFNQFQSCMSGKDPTIIFTGMAILLSKQYWMNKLLSNIYWINY